MHADPELEGALFQVASQFNLLEMTGPSVTPEDGVTRYSHDHTQGPACAIAAGAATIYRNYFAPVDGQSGQTRERQLDAFAIGGGVVDEARPAGVRPLDDEQRLHVVHPHGLDAISGSSRRVATWSATNCGGSLRSDCIAMFRSPMCSTGGASCRRRSARRCRWRTAADPADVGSLRALGLRGDVRGDTVGGGRAIGSRRIEHRVVDPSRRRGVR